MYRASWPPLAIVPCSRLTDKPDGYGGPALGPRGQPDMIDVGAERALVTGEGGNKVFGTWSLGTVWDRLGRGGPDCFH